MTITRELAQLFRLVATPGLSQLMVRVNMVGELTIVAQNPVTKEKRLILVKDEQDTDLLEHAPLEWYLYTNALVAAVRQGLLRVLTDADIEDEEEDIPLIPVVGNPILSPFGAQRGDLLTFDGQNWITVAPGILGQVLTTQGLNNLPQWTTTGAGVGDVVGPSGAPANSIPRFVGTTGKVITSTTVSIDALGRLNMSNARIVNVGAPVDPNDAVNKQYVDDILGPDSWRNAVNAVGLNTPPASPAVGDRYVVGASPTGTWIGHANHLAEWNGTNWDYDIAQHGWVTTSLNSNTIHYFNGSAWSNISSIIDHGSLQGLGDDDHPQYLRGDGTRSMTGSLDMGGFPITNVGNVDGVDVSQHAARHLPNGADPLSTAAAVGLNAASTNTEGSGNSFARNDHTHAIAVGGATTAIAPNNTAGAGTSNNLVREDHSHAVATAAPVATGTTNAAGSANSLAKSDHVHRTLVGAQKAGVSAGARPAFNFTGAGVTVTEDTVNDRINVDIVTAGAGDVHGPASSVVNTIPKFGDLTGKTLVNSAVVIDANDNLVMGGKKVTDLGTPTVPSDATNKAYVDGAFATLDHGSLQGLGDDDHPQYLLASGTRAMAGDLNMAGHDIYNVGTVDGVDVSDHRSRHLPGGADALATAAAVTLTASTTNTEGVAASFARSDHTHAITADVAASSLSATTTNTIGSSAAVARADHTHAIPSAAAVGLNAASTNTTGTGDNFARATHTHAIATGGATTATAPNNTAGAGTSNNLVREDHSHALPTGAPVSTGTTNAAGTANSVSRSDHVHRTEVAIQGGATAIASRPTIDFVGPIVTVTDDPTNDKVIVTIVGGTGSGDVTGPAGATANSVVLFDGATGKMIKESPFTLDGTDLSLGGNKLVDMATPTDPTDAATKGYVDGKVYDHGGLSGLGDDDHTQYLLVSGTRPMGGNLDMGGFSVTNVNLVDGVDVSAHAARHLPGGADALTTAAAVGLSATTTNAEGNAVSFARSNHTHAIPTAAAVTLTATTTNAVGSSVNLARSDHTHAITTAAAVGLTAASTNTVGTAASIARSDHTHALSMGTTTATIAPDNVQGGGSSTALARIDHVHTVATAAPVATGTTNAAGSANSLAKSDHVHRTLVAGAKDGTAVASRPAFNFIGAGVTVADNTVNDRLDVTINANVVGPASVADNAVVIFDGTTGKLLKQSPFRLSGSDLSLENNKLTNVATPTNGTDAANKAYVDGHVFDHGGLSGLGDDDHTQYLLVSGARAMTGALDMGTFLIHNVVSPVDPTDAANKAYVDALLTSSPPAIVNRTAAVVGVSTTAARSDHKHDIAVAAPVTIGTANAQGVAASLALSDHVHAHGDQAGGTLHAEATTTTAGFLSASDKTKLDSVASGATATPLASTAPVSVTKSAAVVGVSTTAARSDHKHDVATDVAVTVGTANAEGTSTSMARADHVHAHGDQLGGTLHAVATTTVPGFMSETDKTKLDGVQAGATANTISNTAPLNVTKAAASAGVSAALARYDHKHDIDTAAAVTIGTSNAEGTSTSMARADHVHAHGDQAGGTLHAVASTTVPGFMSASDKTKLDGVASGAAALTSTAPVNVTKAAAAVGVATDAARADHKHDISTAAPTVGIGTGNAEGTATTMARSDHNHALRLNGADATFGSVPDGTFLALSGTSIVGISPFELSTWKAPARLCAVSNITLSGTQTIDGVAAVAGDRVLVRGQTTGSQNGVYVVAAGAWARATDFDSSAEVVTGANIRVNEGTLHTNTYWSVATTGTIVVGTTSITFAANGLTSVAPVAITKAAAALGSSAQSARADHKHDIMTATAVDLTDSTNAEGTSTSMARADHTHSHGNRGGGTLHAVATTTVPGFMSATDKVKIDNAAVLTSTAPVDVTKATAAVGVATDAARADHKHDISTAAPTAIGSANTEGTATALARADHVHDHGSQTVGTHHAVVTTSVNGFMSATDKTKLDGVAAGATNTALSSTAPVDVTKAAASVGVGTTAARADHKHDISTAAPSTGIGAGNSEGTATSMARSDHNHAFRINGVDVTMGAVADGQALSLSGTTIVGLTADGTPPAWKVAVRLATTANITLSATQTIDGVAAVAGDRILVKNQTTTAQNGIYVVAAGAWTRATDYDATNEVTSGSAVYVQNGTANINTVWTLSTSNPITVGTTGLTYILYGVSSVAPQNVTKATASAGTANQAARVDHKHDVSTAAPIAIGAALAEGTATTLARSDHVHTHGDQLGGTLHAVATTSINGFMSSTDKTKLDGVATGATNTPLTATAPVNVTKAAAAVGVATDAARSDHKHDIATAAPVAIGAALAEGSSTSMARADHVHTHGDQLGGTLHAVATTSVDGFLSASDKTKLDGIAAGATNLALSSTAPADVTKAAASVGVGTTAARADHKHDISTAAAVSLTAGGANAEGTATSMARSDHTHALPGYGTPVAVGTANAAGSATTFARSDHVHATPFSAVNAALAAANATINFNGQELTNISDGFSNSSAATVSQLNNSLLSLPFKAYVDVATTANIALGGLTPIDGVAYSANARILVKNQTNATENGIYTAAAGAWTRAFDAISTAHFANGVLVYVIQGSTNSGSFWASNATRPVSLGTTQIAWTKIVQDEIVKPSVRVSSSVDITLSGLQTIDGINLNAGDRILVRSQVNQVNNGIYVVASGAWTRALDFDTFGGVFGAVYQGTMVRVSEGTLHANTLWAVITANPVSTGSSAIIFSVVGGGDTNQPALVSKSLGLVGSSNFFSRSDHKHDISTAAPVAVGTANSEGTATSMARSDHVHATPFSAVNAALATANATINVNSQRITGVANPSVGTDAVNLDTLNAATSASGPSVVKSPVRVATLADTTLSTLYAIDGVTVVAGDRILVKNQTLPAQNGIYVAATGSWTRATDADTSAKFTVGFQVSVREGTNNANTLWHMTTSPTGFTLGTTGIAIALLQQKRIGSGTAAPTGGIDGDIYLQYT